MPPVRFTSMGIGLTVGAAALIAGGIITGYREFAVIGLAAVVIVLLAVVIPSVATNISLTRLETPRMVARGSTFDVTIEAFSSRTALPTVVIDQFAGRITVVKLPPLEPGRTSMVTYPIHANRRGVHRLGPLREERSDPFSLAIRTLRHDESVEVHVHPVVHPLRLPQSGGHLRQAGVVVNRFSRDPVADFRALRDYVVGDDSRLVHWASTAKTGSLVVRDLIEPQRATRFVVLETADRWLTEAAFEEAVEIAASIVCESIELGINVVAKTLDRDMPGPRRLIYSRQEALQLFTRVARTAPDRTLRTTQLGLTAEPGDQIFLVAGASSPAVAQLSSNPMFAPCLTIVRLHDRTIGVPPTKRAIDVINAEQFALQWRRRSASL